MHYAALLAVSTAQVPSGARLVVTQGFIDVLRDASLPAALEFVRNFKVPAFHTDQDTFSVGVSNVKLKNVDGELDVRLRAPGTIQVKISNLKLGIAADVSVREDIWPNPSASGTATGDADGSSALVALSMTIDADKKPSLTVDSCTADINVNNLAFHGLGILDPIIDWFAGFFKGTISGTLSDMICQQGIRHFLVDAMVNPFFKSLNYTTPFSLLPRPFADAQIDWHVVAPPRVVSGANSTFLAAAVTGEVTPMGGSHDPNATLPEMPDPTAASLRMMTAEVSPYPFNTALHTYFFEGALTYVVLPSLLPPAARGLLNTAFFKTLMPKLYAAYPNANMSLVVRATDAAPKLTIANGRLTLGGAIDLGFQVIDASGGRAVDAFHVRNKHFETSVALSASDGPPTIRGEIADIDLKLSAGRSSFGVLLPVLLAAVSKPLDAVVNSLVLPLVNDILKRGVRIPQLSADLNGYRLTVNLSRPEIDMSGGTFVLIGTDAHVHLQPPPTRAGAARVPGRGGGPHASPLAFFR